MTYSLEAAVVFADGPAATETLAALGQQGQFSTAEVRDKQQNILAFWHPGITPVRIQAILSAIS